MRWVKCTWKNKKEQSVERFRGGSVLPAASASENQPHSWLSHRSAGRTFSSPLWAIPLRGVWVALEAHPSAARLRQAVSDEAANLLIKLGSYSGCQGGGGRGGFTRRLEHCNHHLKLRLKYMSSEASEKIQLWLKQNLQHLSAFT